MRFKRGCNKMNKTLLSILATLGLAVGITTTAKADFYDGCDIPPDKDVQIHNVINVSGDEDNNPQVNYTGIVKYVPEPGFFLAGALSTTNGRLDNPGFGVGYVLDKELGKGSQYLSLLPMLQGNIHLDGSGVTLVPTLYVTGMVGPVTIDPRVQVPIDVDKEGLHPQALSVGATTGVQVADNLRIGLDVAGNYAFQARQASAPDFTAILRYDLQPGGTSWLEFELGSNIQGNAHAALQYRMNF